MKVDYVNWGKRLNEYELRKAQKEYQSFHFNYITVFSAFENNNENLP